MPAGAHAVARRAAAPESEADHPLRQRIRQCRGARAEGPKLAQKQGFDARVLDMAEADLAALPKAEQLLVFASTWGEGDPPQRAADFYTA